MITMDDVDVMISYAKKTAYYLNGEEIANCTDLPDMPNEAVKAVLEARIRVRLAEEKIDEDEDW